VEPLLSMKRLAIITGGAQGIGLATARHFLNDGWRVAVLDIDDNALAELPRLFPDIPLLPIECDVGKESEVSSAFERISAWQEEEPAGIDLLVNNAGISDPVSGAIEDLSLTAWRRWQDSHLNSAFLCTRSAVPGLRKRKGAIVNIASTRAIQSEPHCEAYAAAKGGILALTHALAISLGPDIRVNAVSPGWIETGQLKKPSDRTSPEHRQIDHAQHPVGRVGEADDIAATVAFLADSRTGFVTGQNITVDGGMTRKMQYAD